VKERLDHLFVIKFPPSKEAAEKLNALDNDITDSMRITEEVSERGISKCNNF